MRVPIPFGELTPDRPALGNPGLVVANNCYPVGGGYKPIGQFSASVDGTTGADSLGAAAFRSKAGVTFTISGTATSLTRYTPTAGWANVGGVYTASTSIGWDFAQWGDWIIATNGVDDPQYLDMGAGVPAFTALAGTPPTGEGITVVRDFVVLLRTDGDAMKLQWSGINSATSWTIGTAQSDSQTMPTGGEITGWAGGEYGIILQEDRVVRMSYVGGDAIFQFDEIGSSIGCIAPGSVAQIGRLVFFLSQQGFAVCDGTSVRVVGGEKINRTALAEIDRAYLSQMSSTVDPRNSLIFWAMPNAAEPTVLYCYNYELDRWSTVSQEVQRLFQGLTEGVTLEELDATYPSLDDMTASLDDPQWRGGYPVVALIDDVQRLGTLSGQAKAATFTTGLLSPAFPMRTRLQRATPLIDASGDGVTLTVSAQDLLSETPTETSYATLNRRGEFPARVNAKYMTLTLDVSAGTQWTYATGLDLEFEPGGR